MELDSPLHFTRLKDQSRDVLQCACYTKQAHRDERNTIYLVPRTTVWGTFFSQVNCAEPSRQTSSGMTVRDDLGLFFGIQRELVSAGLTAGAQIAKRR